MGITCKGRFYSLPKMPPMHGFLIFSPRVLRCAGRRFFTSFVLILFASSASAGPDCTVQNADAKQKVVYVHDGDTLWLEDGAKVRMIGLNAPEVARRYDSRSVSEPFGIAARDALRERVMGKTIQLDFDEEKMDRYGRLLAHVFFSDGSSAAAWLLAQGLAQAAPVAPNFAYLDCYTRADRAARKSGLGVWSHPHFAARSAEQLSRRDGGFMLVRGCVRSRASDDAYHYVYLSDAFRFRMDQSLAAPQVQQCLTVRGWVYNSRSYSGKEMTVSHQAAVEDEDVHAGS